MNLTDVLLPLPLVWISHALFWPLLALVVWKAPWRRLASNSEVFHVLMGTTLVLIFLWSMKAGITDGLSLHLIGATLVTLMFGWQFAVLSLCGVLLVVTAYGGAGWEAYALNGLLFAMLPVGVSYGIFRLVDGRLPNNFFVYIFLCAFFGGAIAIGTVGVVSTLVHGLAGTFAPDYLLHNYLSYFALLLFPEAFLTGMLTTIFVVYRPGWVCTFDDDRYLRNH